MEHAIFSVPEKKQTFVVKKNDNRSAEFRSFKIENGQIVGQLKHPSGEEETTILMNDVKQVEKKEFSGAKTVVAILGTFASLVMVAVLALFAFVPRCFDSCE